MDRAVKQLKQEIFLVVVVADTEYLAAKGCVRSVIERAATIKEIF